MCIRDRWDVISELVSEGTTVLLTTQYLDEADQLADDIVVIDQGKVIAHGTSSELKDQIGGDRIEITLDDEQSAARAIDALSPVVSGEPTTEGAQYSAPFAVGSSVLIVAVRALDAQNVGVADIALRRPTLDDVFLTLTGHGAEDQQPERPELSRRGRRGGRR